ncbi:MAG: hypothetical protein LIQ30_08430 [Planctomycetes bacterium]|nr:hypothetical protein [Planctomycetota bacterium]MCC8116109.1 hypothetical protein [Planctomycetota bacterium]MCD7895295.1 hypothetical protein [Planctomycetaceae bacterium]
MTSRGWNWKAKDRANGGLLYEPGNWGDILKLSWLTAVVQWKASGKNSLEYYDPFAGDVSYPLGKKTAARLAAADLDFFTSIDSAFIAHGRWPSAGSAVRPLFTGPALIWEKDDIRRSNWQAVRDVTVVDGIASGWELLYRRSTGAEAVWLLDPYDVLAEWRDWLPVLLERAVTSTVVLYIFNRSGKNREAFREYRAFRNALEDGRGPLPKRLGRAAADVFLPEHYHEMLFLPGVADCEAPGIGELMAELGRRTFALRAAQERAAVFEE